MGAGVRRAVNSGVRQCAGQRPGQRAVLIVTRRKTGRAGIVPAQELPIDPEGAAVGTPTGRKLDMAGWTVTTGEGG